MKRIVSIFLSLLLISAFSFSQTSTDCSAVTIISATNNGVNTISTVSGYDKGFQYVTNEIFVHDETDSSFVRYQEDTSKYIGTNLFYRDSSNYWTLNPNSLVSTDVFDGIQIEIDPDVEIPEFSY